METEELKHKLAEANETIEELKSKIGKESAIKNNLYFFIIQSKMYAKLEEWSNKFPLEKPDNHVIFENFEDADCIPG